MRSAGAGLSGAVISMFKTPAPDLLAAIIDSSDDGIISKTLDGTITSWNRAAERIFGYTADEAIGRSMTMLIPVERLEEETHFLHEVANGRRIERFETERVTKDGRRVPVSVSLSPILDGHGAIVGISSILRDISDRTRLERRAHEAAADLDRILAATDEGIVALDRDLRYVFVNSAAERLVGLSRDVVIGRTPLDIFPPEVSGQVVAQVRAAMTSNEVVRYETYYPPIDRWYENRVYPSPDGVSVFFTDISARKQVEQTLRAREESQRLLVSLNDATRHLRDPDEIMWQLTRRVGRHFRVSRCTYGEIDSAQEHVIVSRDYTDGVGSVAGRHRLNDFGVRLIAELKAGRTVAVSDVADDPRTSDAAAVRSFEAIETRSLLCVPLVKDRRFVALFVLHHHEPRRWSDEDAALMEQVAERTWFAIENARAEAALRESRDVLSLAMRGGRMGAWARNLVTNEVWWSRELEELFGLPAGGFAGTEAGFLSFVHHDHRAAMEEAVQTAIAQRTDYVVEFRFRHSSGAWRWMEGRGRAVYGSDGTPQSLYGLGIDITERKAFEDALAAARDAADSDAERLNLALEAARLGDWSWDLATDVVTFSPRAGEIFDIPPGPHMTWSGMRELLHPDDREPAHRAVQEALVTGRDYAVEYRLINGGRERWVSASGRCRYTERGDAAGMFGVVQDITRDRMLVRVDDAVRPLTDPEEITFTAARILGEHLDVNRCAYASVEADQDAFVFTGNYTAGAPSIVGHYRLRQFGAECLRLMRAGEPYVVDDSADDPRIDAADRLTYERTGIRGVVCVPIMKAGRCVAAMAVHTIGPRRWRPDEVQLVQQVASRCWESIERARVERERAGLLDAAEAANRAKDEFMAMLGHELRNPLAPILTALQLMRLREGRDSERERTVIERQVSHLTRLVDDLLDVSRIARGKVELKLEAVEAYEIVTRAVEVASPLLEERAQTLTIDVPRSGLVVQADAGRLTQVLSNLLNNAAKYTPPAGRVAIAGAREGDEVVLRVSDTGMGIAADVLPSVFDMFVQGHQSLDRAHGGLGLGLTIVKNLVERHGGTVSARSEGPGRGSEFVVRLPLARPAAVSPAGAIALRPAGSDEGASRRVLIVDDNEDAAVMLQEVLRARGYQTRVAHDAVAALDIAGVFEPGTALLDIGLPVMDGYELAARLRERPQGRDMRLIAVTGYGQESDRRKTAAAGFQHHLVKPVDFALLESLLASRPAGDGEDKEA